MSRSQRIDPSFATRLHARARAERWGLSIDQFRDVLEAGAAHVFAGGNPSPTDIERHLGALNITDLALAAACAIGHEAAWDHFVREYRPALYGAADAIDPSGGARDLADALYADLFGLKERGGERQSLFRYYHGRSSLATWLRAVLSQRHIDRLRAGRRTDPLPEDDSSSAGSTPARPFESDAPDPERSRYLGLVRCALAAAIAALAPRDRLRLGCYYAQDMTLSAIGRMLGEHEGTVSRHLTRTRAQVRSTIDEHLCKAGLDQPARAECFRSVMDDAGSIDLAEMVAAPEPGGAPKEPAQRDRKISAEDRSR
jgi:RNA polymerase sigma-70 factor (ECF subfamily)